MWLSSKQSLLWLHGDFHIPTVNRTKIQKTGGDIKTRKWSYSLSIISKNLNILSSKNLTRRNETDIFRGRTDASQVKTDYMTFYSIFISMSCDSVLTVSHFMQYKSCLTNLSSQWHSMESPWLYHWNTGHQIYWSANMLWRLTPAPAICVWTKHVCETGSVIFKTRVGLVLLLSQSHLFPCHEFQQSVHTNNNMEGPKIEPLYTSARKTKIQHLLNQWAGLFLKNKN